MECIVIPVEGEATTAEFSDWTDLLAIIEAPSWESRPMIRGVSSSHYLLTAPGPRNRSEQRTAVENERAGHLIGAHEGSLLDEVVHGTAVIVEYHHSGEGGAEVRGVTDPTSALRAYEEEFANL